MRDAGLDGVETIEDDDELWMRQRVRSAQRRRRASLKVSGRIDRPRRRRSARRPRPAARSSRAPALGLSWLTLDAGDLARRATDSATRSQPRAVHAARRPAGAALRLRRLGPRRRRRAARSWPHQGALRPRAHLPPRRLRGRHLMDLVERRLGRAPPAGPGADQGLRALRLLPADVPELPGLRGGDGLAARAHRADARRPRGGPSVSDEMVTHFDRCLGCMACVTACPSGVQYDKLIEQTRPQIERHADRPLARARAGGAAIFELFTHPGRLRALVPVLALQQKLGPQRRARASSPIPKLQALLGLAPDVPASAAFRQLPEGDAGARRVARADRADAGLRPARVLRRRQRRHRARAGRRGLRGPRAAQAALLRLADDARRASRTRRSRWRARRSPPTRTSTRSRSTSPAAARG